MLVTSWQHKVASKVKWQELHNPMEDEVIIDEIVPIESIEVEVPLEEKKEESEVVEEIQPEEEIAPLV